MVAGGPSDRRIRSIFRSPIVKTGAGYGIFRRDEDCMGSRSQIAEGKEICRTG